MLPAIALLAACAAAPASAQQLRFVTYRTASGVLTLSGGTPLADGDTFTVGSQQWQIDYDRTSSAGLANFTGDYQPSSRFIAITAVPEPTTAAAMLAGLGFLAWRRRPLAAERFVEADQP